MALLCTAGIAYAMPVSRRPIVLQDEARVMLLAEDTLRHGFRLPARVREVPYLNKPPLFFWSVALAALPAGRASARNAPIPSIVAALATLLGVFAIGRQLSGIRTGFMALAVLATCPAFFLHGHEVLPDMMFAAWLTWALLFFLRGLESLPPARAPLLGFYFCVAGALWTKGLPCLMVIPAAVAAAAVTIGVRKLPSFRPVTGLALVALTALPWAVPYVRSPDLEGSQAVSAGQGLNWYLGHFRHHPSIPFVDGLIEFLPWALWLVPAAVWWRLTPDRQAYRPVLAWMAVLLLLLGLSVQQRARYMLPVYPLFALFVAVSVTAAASRPIPAQDPRDDPRRRARHGVDRGRMASPYSAAVRREPDVRLLLGCAVGACQPRGGRHRRPRDRPVGAPGPWLAESGPRMDSRHPDPRLPARRGDLIPPAWHRPIRSRRSPTMSAVPWSAMLRSWRSLRRA